MNSDCIGFLGFHTEARTVFSTHLALLVVQHDESEEQPEKQKAHEGYDGAADLASRHPPEKTDPSVRFRLVVVHQLRRSSHHRRRSRRLGIHRGVIWIRGFFPGMKPCHHFLLDVRVVLWHPRDCPSPFRIPKLLTFPPRVGKRYH